VPALKAVERESASTCRELLRGLKKRQLAPDGINIGLEAFPLGLGKGFKEQFPAARVKLFDIHLSRNALARESMYVKPSGADGRHSIFYASSIQKVTDTLIPISLLYVCVRIVNILFLVK